VSDALSSAAAELAGASAEQVLGWAERRFGATAAIASSFGLEDVALIHLARKVAPSIRIFTLDTGRLPPETYELMDRLRLKLDVEIETWFPEASRVEALVRQKGFLSFRESIENRKECCTIRKVEPLRRALAGKAAWITGLRREQSPTREHVPEVEVDRDHGGLWKLNPLAAWTTAQVWDYVKANKVPYHPFHDQGFPSLGCAPCTRAVKPGEPLRAGRWWWESPEHKECGIHLPEPKP